jgi:hypothetical protein
MCQLKNRAEWTELMWIMVPGSEHDKLGFITARTLAIAGD